MAAVLSFGELSPAFVLQAFTYALIGGLLPALIWLWFWMHEGHDHHEPKFTIWATFIVGMCCVFIVYPFERWSEGFIGGMTGGASSVNNFNILLVWAFFEEAVKFLAAYFIAFRNRREIFDEPIDAFVYLMTAALGFSAMENTFFLLEPLLQGNTLVSVLTGNMRFMGANLLHVASSGVLSLFIAFAYFKPRWAQGTWTLIGLVAATALHAGFNILIVFITERAQGGIFIAFSFVWMTLIFLILILERIKRIKEF